MFLGASFGTQPVTRSISVPLGTAFFFPLVNFEEDSFFAPELSVEQMKQEISDFTDGVTDLYLSVDGVTVSGLTELRAASGPFSVDLPASDDIYSFYGATDVPDSVDVMVSDGYWAFIEPLPAGQHTIVFGGTDIEVIRATYNISVQ
jgi:hypothetical protein